jgi:hypothetical protein
MALEYVHVNACQGWSGGTEWRLAAAMIREGGFRAVHMRLESRICDSWLPVGSHSGCVSPLVGKVLEIGLPERFEFVKHSLCFTFTIQKIPGGVGRLPVRLRFADCWFSAAWRPGKRCM